jgi:hypothetical protein
MPKGSLQARKRVTSQVTDLRFRFTTRKGTTVSTYRWERLAVRSASLRQLQENITARLVGAKRSKSRSGGGCGGVHPPTVYAAKVHVSPVGAAGCSWAGRGARRPPDTPSVASLRDTTRLQPQTTPTQRRGSCTGSPATKQERLERRKGLTAHGSRYAAIRRAAEEVLPAVRPAPTRPAPDPARLELAAMLIGRAASPATSTTTRPPPRSPAPSPPTRPDPSMAPCSARPCDPEARPRNGTGRGRPGRSPSGGWLLVLRLPPPAPSPARSSAATPPA